MIDPNLTGIIIIGIVALVPVAIVTVTKITDMKLKIEQLKAQTAIKTEEIQARNRLDIEKLMMKDNTIIKDNSMVKDDSGVENDSQRLQDEKKKSITMPEDANVRETDTRRRKADA